MTPYQRSHAMLFHSIEKIEQGRKHIGTVVLRLRFSAFASSFLIGFWSHFLLFSISYTRLLRSYSKFTAFTRLLGGHQLELWVSVNWKSNLSIGTIILRSTVFYEHFHTLYTFSTFIQNIYITYSHILLRFCRLALFHFFLSISTLFSQIHNMNVQCVNRTKTISPIPLLPYSLNRKGEKYKTTRQQLYNRTHSLVLHTSN